MTPDERQVLQQFLSDLEESRGAQKDPDADGMINGALSQNPDAAYLLVQHAILADHALQAAQSRIEELQSQVQGGAPAQAPASFLSGGQPQAPSQGGGYGGWNGQGQMQQPRPQPQPQSPLSPNGGLGGFLRNAGTVAAGMAGGEFLAQGLSNLFAPRDW